MLTAMRSLASFSFRHRRLVLAGWLIALVGLAGASGAAGNGYKDSFSLPNTDSTRAFDLLKADSPAASGDQVTAVFSVASGKVTDPGARQRFSAAVQMARSSPVVARVTSPFDAAGARQVSADGAVAFATVTFSGRVPTDIAQDRVKPVVTAMQAQSGGGDTIAVTGQAASGMPAQGAAELIGIIAAGVILFFAFGSLLAMTLPLLTAIVSLGVGVSVVGLLSHGLTIATFAQILTILLGLGVGVDYALFIVSRHRQGLLEGHSPEEAAVRAVNTSGRAVLFAGVTVCIALLGLFSLGVSFLYGVAVASAIGVAVTVVGALTLLPALLGFYGMRVLSRKQRAAVAAGTLNPEDESRRWASWAGQIRRRPALFAVAAAVVVGLLAVPFFSLRLGSSDQGSDPAGSGTRVGYDLLAKGFGPGFNGPLLMVGKLDGQGATAPVERLAAALARDPDVARVTPATYLGGARPGVATPGGTAVLTAYPKSAPQDKATTDLLTRIRDRIVPAAVTGTATTVYVGGQTATFADFGHVLSSKLPLFIGIVVLLSFLLLTVVFRSLLVPLVAAAMNLLSAGAAFGVIVAVFQWGWLGSLFGVDRTGPIQSFLPVILFAILFGLSMDYEVFLISRIHEEWLRRKDNREAVAHGLAATGRTITAAAAIMVFVFASFLLGSDPIIKLFGLGLAGGVLIDALIIRSVLVPALTMLFGRANWWLPAPLERTLPHLSVEANDADAPSNAPAGRVPAPV